eukprot:m.261186 g.261186  ORF g.261186 m.261186 type:complete len:56 (-) comp19222_c0_seq8:82-249(-)
MEVEIVLGYTPPGVPVAEDDAARVARRRQIEEAVLQAQQQEEEEGQAKPQGLASS